MKVVVSEHAIKRGHERLNISKKAMQRQGELAYKRGTPHSKTKGKLRSWLDHEGMQESKHASLYTIFNNHLFIFRDVKEKDETHLITMLKIPTYLTKKLVNYIK